MDSDAEFRRRRSLTALLPCGMGSAGNRRMQDQVNTEIELTIEELEPKIAPDDGETVLPLPKHNPIRQR